MVFQWLKLPQVSSNLRTVFPANRGNFGLFFGSTLQEQLTYVDLSR